MMQELGKRTRLDTLEQEFKAIETRGWRVWGCDCRRDSGPWLLSYVDQAAAATLVRGRLHRGGMQNGVQQPGCFTYWMAVAPVVGSVKERRGSDPQSVFGAARPERTVWRGGQVDHTRHWVTRLFD